MAQTEPISRTPGGRFAPGQSGNPAGRPPNALQIPDILRKIGEETFDGKDKATKYEAMCRTAWEQAIAGDRHARAWIADRIEGTPRQTFHIMQREHDELIEIG